MSEIIYIERQTGEKKIERVYGGAALSLVYGPTRLNRFLNRRFLPLLTRFRWFSYLYGIFQKLPSSARKIVPFIRRFEIDENEFADPVSRFNSFNDFFIRRLKPEARPVDRNPLGAIIPADGRYYFYENCKKVDGFIVKGQKFELEELLGSSSLAREYEEASMTIARLCPSDYHRFHFPCDCIPGSSRLIDGRFDSVNPLAVKQRIRIMSQNIRTLCELQSETFGKILYLEIGAMCVGSIKETYSPEFRQPKGAEKGYFEFGGSSLVLLFPRNRIRFCPDLLNATAQGFEIRCLTGQLMGIRNG